MAVTRHGTIVVWDGLPEFLPASRNREDWSMNSSARQSRGQEGVTNDGISAKRGVVARAMGRFFGVGCLLLALITPAAEIPVPIEESRVLTNLAEIWMVPQASRSKAWRIRTEFVVYYSDPAWGCSWGEYNGVPCYLPLGRSGPQFRAGQRIALDGLVVPEQMAVLWEHSRYQVLEEGLLPAPLSTRGRLDDTRSFQGRWVELEGYVDTIPETDRGHLTLNVLAEEYSFTIYSPDEDATNPPDFQDAYVRLKGVYAVRRSSTKKATKVDLWVPDLRKAEVIGHLRDDERFTRPATPSSQFSEAPTNQLVRVEGIVRSSEPGKNVIIWDDTGQVEIRTLQTKRFSIGQRVEAIGYPDRENILWLLRDGLVRPMTSASTPTAKETSQGKPRKLYLAGQVRELSPEEASRNNPVELEGILLFYQPGIPFIFLQDASGGVCVYWNKPQNRAAPEPGTLVQ
ncbi:MAG TPA: hypothetical protein VEC99_08115, partial [Clostridia bacterium]|nr:hypothetical protein [Clostridia bacterium]